ncbi:hypothetical protein EGW08_022980, partial [Elysia chlorotica]
NCLLISVVARNARLHTNTNLLVASLAFTDVLMGVQCCIIGMTGFSVGVRSWLATSDLHIFDVFMLSINLSLIGVSLLHVFSLALDRYLYVLWPFRYRRYVTRRTVLAVAVVSWTLGLVYALLPLALFNGHRHRQLCILMDIPVSFSYVPIGCVYVVCLGVVTYCTAGLVRLAHQHRRGRPRKLIGNGDSKMELKVNFNVKQEQCARFFNRSNLKIIKFVLVVFVSFLVCTFPPVTLLSLDKIFNLSLFSENDFAIDILRFMVMSNSGINFFSITYMNRDFRRALVKSLP